MAFPPYRRSHFRSKTYDTLVHILAHFPPSTIPTRPLNMPDNDNDRTRKENPEKEPECSKLKAGSDFMDLKSPVPQKEIDKVHETIEGVGDKSIDTCAIEMVLDDIELLMGGEELKLIDELDDGLNPGLCEKPNSGSEVDLMDYQVEDVEFLHFAGNTSRNSNELQVPEELNKPTSEGFHVSTSTKGQASVSVITSSNLNQELLKSDCPAVGFSPLVEDGGFEKEEQYVQKVAEATHISLDPDTNIDALNMSGDVGLLESTILRDTDDTQNGERFCVKNAINSSNTLIEEGGLEEGEISGDFEMDDNSFDVSSADALISEQIKVDEVQKTENVFGNTVYPCKIGNGEKEEGNQSSSFMVSALQDANNNGQVELRTSNQIGIGCGSDLAISRETIESDKAGEYGSVLMPKCSKDRCVGNKSTSDIPTYLVPNQALHIGFLEVATTKDHRDFSVLQQENDASASRKRKCVSDSEEKEYKNKQMVDASRSKKRGSGSEEKKDKKKMKSRMERAKKNRQLGINRLKLPPVQKPKPISYCRHYDQGKCHEGDKCKFSHDIVPSTKSKPCGFFASHSCMKGDDCPFDHQLSKYPCNNFVSTGFCYRGDACLFSHQQENDASASRKRKCVSDSEEKEYKNKQMVDASRSKKRGSGSEEKKDKKKMKSRMERAKKNRQLGINRLKLPPVQKPKPISYCRHYDQGKCHEGDKCKFSHDIVPSTKSKPCGFFASHSCMKGDDCPFDHQLSKYPCNNFVSTGFCYRGDACLFSHQAPTNQGISTPSNVCKPELKSPPLSGNTNSSMPLNNHGGNSVQKNHLTNSKGISEHKPTDTPQMQPTSAPKGVKFINFPSISPIPSTPKQNMVTPNEENIVRSGTCGDQGASGTTQNIAETPKKLPSVTPKGINFLSFGKGPVCSTRSFISSYVNRESNVKLPRLVNFLLSEQASSSLSKDDHNQVSDRAKQNLQQTSPFSLEVLDKNQSMAEGIKSKFAGKALIDDSMNNHSHCKSVQEGDSAMLLPRPFGSHQSSDCPMPGYFKQASTSSQRALLSTLAFAAELESHIKMK